MDCIFRLTVFLSYFKENRIRVYRRKGMLFCWRISHLNENPDLANILWFDLSCAEGIDFK